MIFVPRKNIYTLKGPKWQRGSVSMSAFVNAAQQGAGGGGGEAFNEDITVGNETYCVDGTSDFYTEYGYWVSNYGSITGTTYSDGGANTRTVVVIAWEEQGAGSCSGARVIFRLLGTSIPNTDTTFVDIEWAEGTTYTRTSATYTASIGGHTQWVWSSVSTGPPTSGTHTAIVNT